MIFPSNDIASVDTRVVAVPHYSADTEGKILGKGHTTGATLTWLIPVLWTIDLINLPRRGSRPTLKAESRFTIKVMNDLVITDIAPTLRNQYGFTQRPAEQSEDVQPLQIEAQPTAQPASLDEGREMDAIFVLTDGSQVHANGYGYTEDGQARYRSIENKESYDIPLVAINFDLAVACNPRRGPEMLLPNGLIDYAHASRGGGYNSAPTNQGSGSHFAPMYSGAEQSQGPQQRQVARQLYIAQSQ
jgi:hypothetical protein